MWGGHVPNTQPPPNFSISLLAQGRDKMFRRCNEVFVEEFFDRSDVVPSFLWKGKFSRSSESCGLVVGHVQDETVQQKHISH